MCVICGELVVMPAHSRQKPLVHFTGVVDDSFMRKYQNQIISDIVTWLAFKWPEAAKVC